MKLENVSDVYPLSPMQEGMLFHAVMEPGTGVYVDQAVVTLNGELEPQRFAAQHRLCGRDRQRAGTDTHQPAPVRSHVQRRRVPDRAGVRL